jgi:hypothetical protein
MRLQFFNFPERRDMTVNLSEDGQQLGFCPKSGHLVSVVDEMSLERVYSEYFGFPFQCSFHQLFHIHSSFYRRRYLVSIVQPVYILIKSLRNQL